MDKLKLYAIAVLLVGFAAGINMLVIFFMYESHGLDLVEDGDTIVEEALPAMVTMIVLVITCVLLITCNACMYSSLEPRKKSEKK
jgi:hypothetical protein